MALGALLYAVLFALVLRARDRALARRGAEFERLQLTPVYVFSLLTFALVTIAQAGAGDAAFWPAFISTALMPFAYLGGLLRSHVAHLDAELQREHRRSCGPRARGSCEAGDAERRRLERDLHDGAQSRLVALALLLRSGARAGARATTDVAELLDRAIAELQTSLAELRELARGIHPAVLTERGLEPALESLAARAPVPVTLEARAGTPARRRSRARPTSSSPRRSPTSPSTPAPPQATVTRRARRRPRHRRGRRRRRRRRRRAPRLGPARARGPGRRARRHAGAREPAGPRHAAAGARSRCGASGATTDPFVTLLRSMATTPADRHHDLRGPARR